MTRVDAVDLGADQELLLTREQLVKLLQERRVSGGTQVGIVGIVDLAQPMRVEQCLLLFAELGLDVVQLLDDPQIGFDVRRADDVGALEHHVLEQVCHAGDAGPLVDGADFRDPAGGDVRVAASWHHQQRHAVLERVLLRVDLLSRRRSRQDQREKHRHDRDTFRHQRDLLL